MNTDESKKVIQKLLDKYSNIAQNKRIAGYNEEMTKKDFILPLFRALGWDVENSNEVSAEERISKGRVDYGFRINGIPKFFLEAKPLHEKLDNPKFVEQAINYAWFKGCTWAVLTNFEYVRIFNAEWKTTNLAQSHLKTISCDEFLIRFDELWLLSRESLEQGLLDKEAEHWGKKTRRTTIDKQLLADFTRFRELLSKNIMKLNQSKNLTEEELDESVQRILDRLIFIRNCEDRQLEEPILKSMVNVWEKKGKGLLAKGLRQIFAYYDKNYNSKIFASHLCDDVKIDDDVIHKIIDGLYFTQDRSVSYDFSAIEADVLGNIYEQYLGHILKKSEKRAKLTENHAHRKEQGIYYTPTYIVDYIVKNTLGELLKDEKVNPEKIRVLDPACGSGSFLIKAFDLLNEYWKKHSKDYNQQQIDIEGETDLPYNTKIKILENNIFGVDLDKQAVEIAQLNLLLKVTEKGQRLPLLQQNIKCGNSLIDDPRVAGGKAFKWEEEFPEVFKKKELKAYHITWVAYNSRVSERMKAYEEVIKQRRLNKGLQPLVHGWIFDEEMEIVITKSILEIVKEDALRVLAYNICQDHVHLILVCAENELTEIVRKLKGKSSQKVKEWLGIPATEKFHLWAQKFNVSYLGIVNKGLEPLVEDGCAEEDRLEPLVEDGRAEEDRLEPLVEDGRAEEDRLEPLANSERQVDKEQMPLASALMSAIEYVASNRAKHNLPVNKGLEPLVQSMLTPLQDAFKPQYEGGFDVVIGNPPYGAELKPVEKRYFTSRYSLNQGRLDTSLLFIERSLTLLKENGFLGFIVPVRWLVGTYAKRLRKSILDLTTIRNIVYFPSHVFEDAAIDTILIILQKGKRKQSILVSFVKELPFKNLSEIEFQQDEWDKDNFEFHIFLDKDSKTILNHIKSTKTRLRDVCQGFLGIQAYEKASDREKFGEFISTRPLQGFEPELSGEHISRYFINWKGDLFIKYSKKLYNARETQFFKQPKIVIRRILKNRIIAALDSDGFYTSDMVYNLLPINKDVNLKFILAILNSKLISFLYTKENYDLSVTFPKLRVSAFQELPIRLIPESQQQPLINLVDKMLSLNRRLNELSDKKTDERARIEEEIKKTDKEIDALVYQIYGLTEEEIRIVGAY